MPISRRQFLRTSLLVPLGAVALSGCSNAPPLSVARHVWPGYEFIGFAQQSGFHNSDSVAFLKTSSAFESMEAIITGQVDAAALTLDEVILCRSLGAPLKVVMVFNISSGADMLVAKRSITSLQGLKGQRIGSEDSTLSNLILNKLLKQAGLSRQEVTIVPVPILQQVDAWQQNQVDAVITYEPQASKLIQLGGKRLFDSRQMPETIFDVLAVRSDRLPLQESHVIELIDGHFKALDQFIKNPVDTAYRLAVSLSLTGDEVLKAYSGLQLPSRSLNVDFLAEGGRLVQVAAELSQLMQQQGSVSQPDDLQGLVSNHYLRHT